MSCPPPGPVIQDKASWRSGSGSGPRHTGPPDHLTRQCPACQAIKCPATATPGGRPARGPTGGKPAAPQSGWPPGTSMLRGARATWGCSGCGASKEGAAEAPMGHPTLNA